jgi:hypothetical protein
MRIMLYLFGLRFKKLFFSRSLSEDSGIVILLIVALLNGLGIGYLSNKLDGQTQNIIVLHQIVNVAYLSIPFFSRFFPSVSFSKPVIQAYFPLNKIESSLIELYSIRFLTVRNICLLISLLLIFAIAHNFKFQDMLLCFVLFIIANTFSEIILDALYYRKAGFLAVGILSTLPVILACFYFNYSYSTCLLTGFISIIILTIIFALLFSTRNENVYRPGVSKQNPHGHLSTNNILVKMAYKKSVLMNMLSVALFFKLVMIGYLFLYTNENNTSPDHHIFFYLVLSPLVYSCYVLNNFWGYVKEMSLNLVIAPVDFDYYIRSYFLMISPVILIDGGLTLIYCSLTSGFALHNLILYCSLTIFSVVFSLFSSFQKPFKAYRKFSLVNFKSNTNVVNNFIIIIPALVYFLFHKSENIFYPFSIFLVAISLILIVLIYGKREELTLTIKNALTLNTANQ